MNNFKELRVRQSAIDLVASIYELTEAFPNREMYGFTQQIRQAAVSIPSNIADENQVRSLVVSLQKLEDSGFTKLQTPNPKPEAR